MKPTRILPLSFALFSLGSFVALGQNNAMARDAELDRKYTPAGNSLFNNLNKPATDSRSGGAIAIKNAIKFCPTTLLRQKVLFYYERELFSGIALNLGLGKAFGDDAVQRTFFGLQSGLDLSDMMSPYDMLSNAQYQGSSPYLSIGAKVYFSGNTLEDSYVEFSYRHERLDYLLNPTINGYEVQGSRSVSFQMNAISFGFGYIATSGHKENFVHELYINFGVKYFKVPRFDKYEVPVGYTTQEVYKNSGTEISARLLPAVNMGYCFGFGF